MPSEKMPPVTLLSIFFRKTETATMKRQRPPVNLAFEFAAWSPDAAIFRQPAPRL
jgi:hypothetical protein